MYAYYTYTYIHIYICSRPPPHDPAEPAFCKQWIMGGGQPQMQKTSPGSNFHKIVEAGNATTSPGSNFPKIPKISATTAPHAAARLIDARNLGMLGKFEPGEVFAFQVCKLCGNSSLVVFWQLRMRKHRQAPISPKFVKLEVRNHRQAPISPKFPKAQQLRPLTPHRCQDFRNFGEIRAWRCFGNFGCENIARLQFPQNL